MGDDPATLHVSEALTFVERRAKVLLQGPNDASLVVPSRPHAAVPPKVHRAEIGVMEDHLAANGEERKPPADLLCRMVEQVASIDKQQVWWPSRY